MGKAFYITRLVIYTIASFFSLVLLGLSARVLAFDGSFGLAGGDGYAGLAIACSLFTKIAMVGVLITEFLRRDTWASWTAVELGVLGFLWLMWFASACFTTSIFAPMNLGGCGADSAYVVSIWRAYGGASKADAQAICAQVEGIMGLTWLIFLMVSAILTWLIVIVIQASQAGHTGIWTSSAVWYDPRNPPAPRPMGQMGGGGGGGNWNTYQMGDQGQGHVAPSHFVGNQGQYTQMPPQQQQYGPNANQQYGQPQYQTGQNQLFGHPQQRNGPPQSFGQPQYQPGQNAAYGQSMQPSGPQQSYGQPQYQNAQNPLYGQPQYGGQPSGPGSYVKAAEV